MDYNKKLLEQIKLITEIYALEHNISNWENDKLIKLRSALIEALDHKKIF